MLVPTPKKFRRLGNALLSLTTAVAIPSWATDHKWIGWSIFAAGVLGRFLVELFAEDTPPTP